MISGQCYTMLLSLEDPDISKVFSWDMWGIKFAIFFVQIPEINNNVTDKLDFEF